MKTRAELFAFLDAIGVAHPTLDHPAVFRVGEGEAIKRTLPGVHTKNLFLRDARGALWLVSAADRAAIDLKGLPAVIGSGRLSFGPAALLEATLGVTAGSVTALALINDPEHAVGFVLDQTLAAAAQVNFHPLENTATTTLTGEGFRRFLAALGVAPVIVDFAALR